MQPCRQEERAPRRLSLRERPKLMPPVRRSGVARSRRHRPAGTGAAGGTRATGSARGRRVMPPDRQVRPVSGVCDVSTPRSRLLRGLRAGVPSRAHHTRAAAPWLRARARRLCCAHAAGRPAPALPPGGPPPRAPQQATAAPCPCAGCEGTSCVSHARPALAAGAALSERLTSARPR